MSKTSGKFKLPKRQKVQENSNSPNPVVSITIKRHSLCFLFGPIFISTLLYNHINYSNTGGAKHKGDLTF